MSGEYLAGGSAMYESDEMRCAAWDDELRETALRDCINAHRGVSGTAGRSNDGDQRTDERRQHGGGGTASVHGVVKRNSGGDGRTARAGSEKFERRGAVEWD